MQSARIERATFRFQIAELLVKVRLRRETHRERVTSLTLSQLSYDCNY